MRNPDLEQIEYYKGRFEQVFETNRCLLEMLRARDKSLAELREKLKEYEDKDENPSDVGHT